MIVLSQTLVITGANRGIGLAFSTYYAKQGAKVYAVCRQASSALEALEVTVLSGIDVSKADAIPMLRNALEGESIDLLINNAGILRDERLGEIDFDQITEQFQVNALGPLRVVEALLDFMPDGSKIANITSRMGSIEDNTSGGRYGYRMSKCALNIASVSLAHDLRARDIAVGIFHPGLVGTEMIGGYGDITPEQAAERLVKLIDQLDMSRSGEFRHSNGELLPW